MVTRNRCAALYVQQSAVPGITNLTGEQAEGIDLRLIARRYIEKAGPGALQVSPVALCFQTEDPGTGLPSIANLAAGHRAARVMATFGKSRSSHRSPLSSAGAPWCRDAQQDQQRKQGQPSPK